MAILIPRTQTVSAFSYSVLFTGPNGSSEIGQFQSFTPSSTRTITRVRALSQGSIAGECIELVESITDHTISVTALELYRKEVMEFMGYSNFASIEDLKDPVDIREIRTDPNGVDTIIDWQACKLNSYTRGGITAGGNVVTATASFYVTRVRRIK